jgi:hypothetical protein
MYFISITVALLILIGCNLTYNIRSNLLAESLGTLSAILASITLLLFLYFVLSRKVEKTNKKGRQTKEKLDRIELELIKSKEFEERTRCTTNNKRSYQQIESISDNNKNNLIRNSTLTNRNFYNQVKGETTERQLIDLTSMSDG